MLSAVVDYVVNGRHMHEVRECVQSLVDLVVQMVEGDDAQAGNICLQYNAADLVGVNGEPLTPTQFHRNSHLDRCEAIYKVGAAATGLVAIGQHLDRCPCFKADKVSMHIIHLYGETPYSCHMHL